MSIRIRKINGKMIAICAARSEPKEGDIYLDDNAQYALSTKFAQDFHSMGFMNDHKGDSELIKLMEHEETMENTTMNKYHDKLRGLSYGEITALYADGKITEIEMYYMKRDYSILLLEKLMDSYDSMTK